MPFLILSEEELKESNPLRQTAKSYHAFYGMRAANDVLVVGRFSRSYPKPFLHEEHFEALRGRDVYEPNMPYRIEYTYLDAFEFTGGKIENGMLVPFSQKDIDVTVRFSADYGGVWDNLPDEGSELIGVLHHQEKSDPAAYELKLSICPVYYPIEPMVLDDLLACIREGKCLER